MSLQIGQIVKNSNIGSSTSSAYLQDVDYISTTVQVKTYNDYAITPTSGVFSSKNSYYLRYSLEGIKPRTYAGLYSVADDQINPNNIVLSLVLYTNDGSTTWGSHDLGTYQVIQQPVIVRAGHTYTKELIFTPNKDYKYLGFVINRVPADKNISPKRNPITDQTLDLEDNGDIAIINNILPQTADKIGVQSRPGTLLCINHEQIRIGRTGVYEINNGVKVSFFGIASANGSDEKNINDFILDYAWNE